MHSVERLAIKLPHDTNKEDAELLRLEDQRRQDELDLMEHRRASWTKWWREQRESND